YETAFTTSITYQNIGDGTANSVAILFYKDQNDTSPTVINRPTLAKGAGTSIYIGDVNLSSNFRGTAVMTSDQPMAATLVQTAGSTTIKARPLSNGFSGGTENSLVASFFKKPGNKSILSVQNAGGDTVSVTLKFFAIGATAATYESTQTLQPGAGYIVDAGNTTIISATDWEGSVVLETSGGSIVSSILELGSGTGKNDAKAFEGIGAGSTTFYLPTALCKDAGPTTYFAVQNTSTTVGDVASVKITFTPVGGGATYEQSATINPGNKTSFNTCATPGMPHPFSGSAVVESTVDSIPVIAIGKVVGGGLATAFEGVSTGATILALPYVRYADNTNWFLGKQQRTFIAIQNIGADIPAGESITVKYIKFDGSILSIHTIPGPIDQYAKVNSNPTLGTPTLTSFGYYTGTSGGSVLIEGPAGSQLAAIARVQTYNGTLQAGEDYNAIPVTSSTP
ncbi:MAG: hypothetical protein ACKOC5_04775, partial [Chloroflexota bacterium]